MLHRGINSWRKWYNCTCDSIREAGLSYFRLVKRWIGINVTIKLCKTKNVALFFRKISVVTTILPLVLFLRVPWDRTLYCCCYKIAKELSSLQKSFFRSSVGVNGVQDGFTFTFTLLILAATNQLPIAAISKIQKYKNTVQGGFALQPINFPPWSHIMKEAQTQRQEHLENISQKCETALFQVFQVGFGLPYHILRLPEVWFGPKGPESPKVNKNPTLISKNSQWHQGR